MPLICYWRITNTSIGLTFVHNITINYQAEELSIGEYQNFHTKERKISKEIYNKLAEAVIESEMADAEAFANEALDILEPVMVGDQVREVAGTIVLGKVEGDLHEIGRTSRWNHVDCKRIQSHRYWRG